jgi:hypothetical protein
MAHIDMNLPEEIPYTKKRMLDWHIDDENRVISMSCNYSSLSEMQKCMRKAQYSLVRELIPSTESPALTIGTGVHKALEIWYSSPPEERTRSDLRSDQELDALLRGEEVAASSVRIQSIQALLTYCAPLLGRTELGAREPSRVAEIVNNYFDHYIDDDYEVALDEDGKPLIEKSFETPLRTQSIFFNGERYDFLLKLHGTIDMVLRSRSGDIILADHKTAKSIGKEFISRLAPNHQYVAYWHGAQNELGLNPTQFMVNGIQIAKTKMDYKRLFRRVTSEDIYELAEAMTDACVRFIHHLEANEFPMSAPDSCSMWGGCRYHSLCEVNNSKLREQLIGATYETQ